MKSSWLLFIIVALLGIGAGYAVSFYSGDLSPPPDPMPESTSEPNTATPAEVEAARAARTQHLINDNAPKQAPDFRLPDLAGVERSLADWPDQVIVLNFWATWCPPCLKEIPLFVDLQDQYGTHGLQFIGVALDEQAAVQEFLAQFAVNYPILLGGTQGIQLVQQYGNRLGVLPFTVVIDPAGMVVVRHPGELTEQDFQQSILPLLSATE